MGDLDADGVVDLAVGADLDDDGGSNRGALYILFLNADGTVKAEQKMSDSTVRLAPFAPLPPRAPSLSKRSHFAPPHPS